MKSANWTRASDVAFLLSRWFDLWSSCIWVGSFVTL